MAMGKPRIPYCVVCCLLATGCDPTTTTSQFVRLRVVDSASGQPLEGAKVSLKFDYGSDQPLPPKHEEEVLPPEEWDEINCVRWVEQRLLRGVTDKHGQADIDLVYTGVDRTRGSKPPSSEDLTGTPYLVRVEEGQLPEEELRVVMKPGASVKGKAYTVTVIEIQEPRYVPNAEWEDTLKE